MSLHIEWRLPEGTSQVVYPCRCGVSHRGPYAAEDRNHHECFHGSLVLLDPLGNQERQAMCTQCGEVFEILSEGNDASVLPRSWFETG